jgi:uncharacterized membrane protein
MKLNYPKDGKVLRNISLQVKNIYDNPLVIVGGLTLFGAIIRFYHLGFKPLWLDEAVMYWISNSGSAKNIIAQNAYLNSAPPLFAFLINLILKIGDSETILRLIPWLGGVASIPAMYFLSRQFTERTSAYFSTLMVAIAVSQVTYSQQLREYSLTFLITCIILALFHIQLRHPTWKNLAFMTFAMVTGIFLQYGLALLIFAMNLVSFIELFPTKANRKLWLLKWGISQLFVLCAIIVVCYLSLGQQMTIGFGATGTNMYLTGSYWNGSLISLFRLAVSNTYNIFIFTFPSGIFLFIAGVGLIFTLRDRNSHTAMIMFAFPTILTFIMAFAKLYPYQGARQDMFLTPMIYVLVGLGFGHLLNTIQQRWITSLLVFLIITSGISSTFSYLNDPGYENIRPIISTLSKSFRSGDKIYVYYAAQPAFTYYYRDHIDSQVFSISSRGNPTSYFQEIDKILLSNSRIWMVFTYCYADECEIIPKYVSKYQEVDLVASANDFWLYLAR